MISSLFFVQEFLTSAHGVKALYTISWLNLSRKCQGEACVCVAGCKVPRTNQYLVQEGWVALCHLVTSVVACRVH